MVMVVILVLGASAALVGSLSTAGLQIKRDEKTTLALAQAKEALIGKSILYDDYPGSLPCPDAITNIPGTNVPDDGIADLLSGNDCPSYVGRLPWKTLGMPDLRDATGERLWYALSRSVRRHANVMPLNSTTVQGTLDLDGANTNLIAIIFAPGNPVGTQDRSSTSSSCTTTGDSRAGNLCASNYLEGTNDDLNTGASQNTAFQSFDANIDFNDQLITLSRDQLFVRVEQRVGGEFRHHLNDYYASWGAYPFAAPFSDPSAANYKGATSNLEGLYPFGSLNGIGSIPPTPEWSSSPITISFSNGSTPTFTCQRRDSNDDGFYERVRCTEDTSYSYVTLPEGDTVAMTAKLQNVGRGFWKMFSLDLDNNSKCDSIYDDCSIEQVRVRDKYDNYQLAKDIFDPDSISISGKLNYSDGSATVVFSAKGKTGGSQFQRIDIRNIQYESGTLPNWIKNNNWHQLLYYAVSPGNAPAGTGGTSSITCTTTPGPDQCLTLSGANSGNDKKAVVILTGPTLTGQNRPSSNINDYLEGANASTGDQTFENQSTSSSFNDHVFVVAP